MNDDCIFEGFEPANTTPLPDVLFDELLTELTGSELKVLLYIIRRTRGFKKETDAISLTQFQKGITTKEGKVLDKGCGVKDRASILRALHALEAKGCIQREQNMSPLGDKDTCLYRIRFKEVGGNSNQGGRENQLPVVGDSNLQETVIQETDTNVSVGVAPPAQNAENTPSQRRKRKPPTTAKPKEPEVAFSPDELEVWSEWIKAPWHGGAVPLPQKNDAEHLHHLSIYRETAYPPTVENLQKCKKWATSKEVDRKQWYKSIGWSLYWQAREYPRWIAAQIDDESPPEPPENVVAMNSRIGVSGRRRVNDDDIPPEFLEAMMGGNR